MRYFMAIWPRGNETHARLIPLSATSRKTARVAMDAAFDTESKNIGLAEAMLVSESEAPKLFGKRWEKRIVQR